MDYGLSRIILIDSYLPRQIYKIEVDGQTNIVGENKLGKTSFIKLIVLLYGALPKNIGIKTDIETKQKSFAEYYLPRTSSYIIFEYLSNGKPRMLVMTSSHDAKDQFIRTFVKSGFKEEDFWHKDSDIPITSNEWLRSTASKYHVEKCRGADSQNKILLEGKNSTFSMVPSRLNLTRLREIMTSAFSRNSFTTDINGVINDWICNDLGQDFSERADATSIRRDELDNWVNNYYCLKKFEQEKPHFKTLGECLIHHELSDTQAKRLYQLGKIKHFEIEKTIEKKEKEYKDKQTKLEEELTNRNNERITALTEKNKHEKNYNQLISSKETLISTLEIYKKAIPKNLYQLETENDYSLSKADELERIIRELTEKQLKANEFLEKASARSLADFKDKKSSIVLQQANAENEKINAINAFNKELDETSKNEKIKINDDKEKLEKRRYETIEKSSTLKGRLFSPSLPTNEYDTQKSIQKQISETLKKLNELEKSAEKAKNQIEQIKKEQKTISSEMSEKSTSLKDLDQEFQDISSIINAQDGSFLSYLKREVPHWQETHGRVLKREIFNLKGLEPKLVNNSSPNTIFGVEISTDKLPLGDFEVYDEKNLIERQNQLYEEIEKLNTEIDKLNNKFMRLNKEVDRADKEFTFADNILKKTKKEHQHLNQDLESENNRLSEKLKNLKIQLEQDLEQAEEETKAIGIKIKACINELKKHEADIENQKENFEKEVQALCDKNIDYLNIKLKEAEKEKIDNEQKINDQFNEMLKNGGVDLEYLQQLNKELKKFRAQNEEYDYAKGKETAYLKYKNEEYEPEYKKLELKIPQVAELKKESIANLEKLTSLCLHIKNQQEAIENEHRVLRRALMSDTTKLEQSILSHTHYDNHAVKPLCHADYTVQRLCEHFEREKKSVKETAIQIEGIKKLLLPLFEKAGTYSFYYMKEEGLNTQDSMQVAKRINSYMSDGFYKINYGSFIQSSEFLRRVDLFSHCFRQYKQKIKAYNRGLNHYMAKTTGFYGIDDLEVEIIFQHSEREDWALIEDINRHYKIWNENRNEGIFNSAETNLPSQELVTAVERYKDGHNPENMSVSEFYKYIDFSAKVVDSGQQKTVKSLLKIMSDKSAVSSRGASYLILIMIFIAIVNMMRQDNKVHVAWALDELADISPENITNLLRILKENNINMISACTVIDQAVYYCFDKNYSIEVDHQTNQIVLIEQDIDQQLSFLNSILDDEINSETLGEIHAS